MLFDKQLLYLAFIFGTEQALGVPLASSHVSAQISAASPSASTTSAVLKAVAQAKKIYSLQNGNSTSSAASLSSSLAKSSGPVFGSSSTLAAVISASASSIALPSQSFNRLSPASLTSSNSVDFLSSFAIASPSSSASGYVLSASSIAGSVTQHNNMAQSSSSLGGFLNSLASEAVSILAAEASSTDAPSLTTSVSVSVAGAPSPTTKNALSSIIAALPAPLQSEASVITHALGGGSTTATNTSKPTRTDGPHKSRTRRPGNHGRPTKHLPTTQSTSTPTTILTKSSSTLTKTTMTTQMLPTTEAATGRGSIGAHPLPTASVAGIASGLTAGAVVAALAGVYLWRRKREGKPLFKRQDSQTSNRAYPEVAWLYDPKISPPGTPGRSRANSAAENVNLIPAARGGSVEMETISASPSPNLRPTTPPNRASSPLLTPYMPPPRDRSPDGSPSGSSGRRSRSSRGSSVDNLRRPLSGIHEE